MARSTWRRWPSTPERNSEAPTIPVVHPLFQSVNFVQEIGTGDGLRYPRYGNSPNAELVQRRLAALEGAEAAILLSSGMGATACALLALLRPGDHLLASAWIYGGATALLTKEFTALGIEVTLVDPTVQRIWRKHLRKDDARDLSRVARQSDVPRARPQADQLHHQGVRHRARGGFHFREPDQLPPDRARRGRRHSLRDEIPERASRRARRRGLRNGAVRRRSPAEDDDVGSGSGSVRRWLLERGLKTLDVRVQRHNENAMRIARVVRGAEGDQARALSGSGEPSGSRDRRVDDETALAG